MGTSTEVRNSRRAAVEASVKPKPDPSMIIESYSYAARFIEFVMADGSTIEISTGDTGLFMERGSA